MINRLAAALLIAFAPAAAAETWLKIDPNDPFSKNGEFHHFDVDSGFEDPATGYVAATMIYVKPEDAKPGVKTARNVWAFDCTANTVYYVAVSTEPEGTKVTADWSAKPNALKEPVMGGVTNLFGKKVCALKGSWPKRDLPRK
jgi:hypothetical protein